MNRGGVIIFLHGIVCALLIMQSAMVNEGIAGLQKVKRVIAEANKEIEVTWIRGDSEIKTAVQLGNQLLVSTIKPKNKSMFLFSVGITFRNRGNEALIFHKNDFSMIVGTKSFLPIGHLYNTSMVVESNENVEMSVGSQSEKELVFTFPVPRSGSTFLFKFGVLLAVEVPRPPID